MVRRTRWTSTTAGFFLLPRGLTRTYPRLTAVLKEPARAPWYLLGVHVDAFHLEAEGLLNPSDMAPCRSGVVCGTAELTEGKRLDSSRQETVPAPDRGIERGSEPRNDERLMLRGIRCAFREERPGTF